jgi:hypothetical protein
MISGSKFFSQGGAVVARSLEVLETPRAVGSRCARRPCARCGDWRRSASTLASKGARRPPSKEAARKASKLAARELEKLGGQSLPEPDLQHRKRTLIRGPKEFRDIRADLPKTKS